MGGHEIVTPELREKLSDALNSMPPMLSLPNDLH
jgi:hypothetical protein